MDCGSIMAYTQREYSRDNAAFIANPPSALAQVFNKTGDYTIQLADLSYFWGKGGGAVFTNLGTSGNVVFTLPENPGAGYSVVFCNILGTNVLRVNASGSDTITQGTVDGRVFVSTTYAQGLLMIQSIGSNLWACNNFGPASGG